MLPFGHGDRVEGRGPQWRDLWMARRGMSIHSISFGSEFLTSQQVRYNLVQENEEQTLVAVLPHVSKSDVSIWLRSYRYLTDRNFFSSNSVVLGTINSASRRRICRVRSSPLPSHRTPPVLRRQTASECCSWCCEICIVLVCVSDATLLTRFSPFHV